MSKPGLRIIRSNAMPEVILGLVRAHRGQRRSGMEGRYFVPMYGHVVSSSYAVREGASLGPQGMQVFTGAVLVYVRMHVIMEETNYLHRQHIMRL